MAIFVATFAILFWGAVASSMAGSPEACGVTGPTTSLIAKLRSTAGPASTCGGAFDVAEPKEKVCCGGSLCNCQCTGSDCVLTHNGSGNNICNGGPKKLVASGKCTA